jgi:CheY-like chemotaxis protein
LQLHGIAAVGAETLDQGIAALEHGPEIRVIACDVRLGEESGFDIVARIAAHPALSARPFHYVFITGDPLGCNSLPAALPHSLLTKPVRPRVLIGLVKDLLMIEGA